MSSQVIPPDFIVDESLVRALVHGQFGLEIASCRLIGEGFDNAVFLINEHLVFRFPRRRVAICLIEREIRLLGGLSQVLDIAIPKPLFVGMRTDNYEAPFYGHEMLPGRTGCSVDLSSEEQHQLSHDLGHFLHRLHRVDTTTISLNPLDLTPVFDRVEKDQMLIWLWERYDSVKNAYNLKVLQHKIDVIVQHANIYIPKQEASVLVHGDLYHRHVLFNEKNQLSGVIDWGDSCLSDRVVDFSIVYQFLPKNTHTSFFASYGPVREEEKAYARFLGLYYAIALLWFGHDRHDKALIRTSLATLEII